MVSQKQMITAGAIAASVLGREVWLRSREENLSGQVAMITGGSRGLGLAMARVLADEGCKLVICSRNEAELDEARRDLLDRGADVLAIRCDVANQAQVEQQVAIATARFGPIDLLINNAGVVQVGPLESCRLDDFQQAMDIMFWGTLYPTLAVLPSMRERKRGRIVNITSIGGRFGMAHMLPYDAAKFAATGLSEGLHAELAKDGISVTTITPGLMRTGSHLNAIFKGNADQEFTWFSLGASLPIVSMDADRAARQIIRAAKRKETDRVITFPAWFASRIHGVAPGLTAETIGIVNRLLPKPNGEQEMTGMEVEQTSPHRWRDSATGMGRSAATRLNQFPSDPASAATHGQFSASDRTSP
jgi:NAD(P)-dependent dehydrogenase (short-subunit alcohol dehydrogenase family)